MKKILLFFVFLFVASNSFALQQTLNDGETLLIIRTKINENFTENYGDIATLDAGKLESIDIDTLAELNAILTDAILIDDGDIADSILIGLNNGGTYTNYGVAGDDSLNELFNAINTKFGSLAGGHDAVTIGTGNGLSLLSQVLSLSTATNSSNGAMSSAWITFLESIDTEAEFKTLYNLESGTDFYTIVAVDTLLANKLGIANIDDIPVNGVVNAPISSNWAYDHLNDADPHTQYMEQSNLDLLQTDDLNTLSGVAIGETDLGTFTGTTIQDNGTVKDALQDLETEVETKQDAFNTLSGLNSVLTDADVIDVGDISDSILIGLISGAAYTNYGAVSDDSVNEMFLAIDNAIGGLGGGHDPITIGTANGLSLLTQVLSLSLATNSANGAMSSTWITFLETIDTEAELKSAYNLEIGTDIEGLLTNSAGLLAALSDETGTGLSVFNNTPTLVSPILGTITSGDGGNLTNLDGENIQDDSIDDDSIDLTDVTLDDFTFDVGSVDKTEFGYLDGVTSGIQTQFTGKQSVLTNEAGLYGALSDVADFVQTLEIDSAGELETVANLGAYASNILDVSNATGLLALILAEDFNIIGGLTPTGDVDFTTANSVSMGKLTWADTDTESSEVGEFRYNNTIAGLLDGGFEWYDDDERQIVISVPADTFGTGPTDDYILAYDADVDEHYYKVESGGSSPPTFQADDPTANDSDGYYFATTSGDGFYVRNGIDVWNISGGTRALYYLLTLSDPGNGNTITSTDAFLDCGDGASDCTYEYVASSIPEITGTAASGYEFLVWTGDATDTSTTTNPDDITMDADKSVGGTFNLLPTITSSAIDGTSVVLTASENSTQGTGWLDNFTIDGTTMGSGIGLTYVSGDGTSTHNFTAATAAIFGETITIDYPGTADGLEDGDGGDLAAIVGASVTNNTGGSALLYDDFEGAATLWSDTNTASGATIDHSASPDGAYDCTDIGTYVLDLTYGTASGNLWTVADAGVMGTEGTDYYFHVTSKVVAETALSAFGSVKLIQFDSSTSPDFGNINLLLRKPTSSTYQYRLMMNGSTFVADTGNLTITADDEIGIRWKIVTGAANDEVELYLNNVSVGSLTDTEITEVPRYVFFGGAAGTGHYNLQMQYNNVEVNDAAMPSDCPN